MSQVNSSRYFVVDDHDPSISYSGPAWFRDRQLGGEYSKGSSGTFENGSISFSFEGPSRGYIGAYGTLPIQSSTTPNWTCSIDGVQLNDPVLALAGLPIPTESSEDYWPFCQGYTGPNEGTHTLNIDIRSPPDITFPFYLSYIVYEPRLASLVSSQTQFEEEFLVGENVEDENIDLWIWGTDQGFNFSGQWDAIPNTNATSSRSGSSLRLDFLGHSVSLFTRTTNNFLNGVSLATYQVDEGIPTIFQTPRSNTTGFLFKTPDLEFGNHSLKLIDQAIGFSYLNIDHAIIHRSLSSSSTVTNSNGLSRPQVIRLAVALPLIFLMLCVCGFLFWRNRRRKMIGLEGNQKEEELIFTPFILPPTHSHHQTLPIVQHHTTTKEKRENLQFDPTHPIVLLPPAGLGSNGPSSSTTMLNTNIPVPAIISTTLQHNISTGDIARPSVNPLTFDGPNVVSSIRPEPIREVDSGVRRLDPEILPPLYTAH